MMFIDKAVVQVLDVAFGGSVSRTHDRFVVMGYLLTTSGSFRGGTRR